MSIFAQLHWRRVLVAGFFAEVLVFAIVFAVLSLFGQLAFLVSILAASALMPLVFAMWVGRALTSRFVLHGVLVGLVAALVYMVIAWGQPQPFLYHVAHVLKVGGGLAGGWLMQRRRSRPKESHVNAPLAL